jgi:UDP-glucose 4-epimerase
VEDPRAAERVPRGRATQGRRIVVLGGTGLLGAEIARCSLELDDAVTILSRRAPDEATSAMLAGARILTGDATDAASLSLALKGATHVVFALGAPTPAASDAERSAELLVLDAVLATLDVDGEVRLTYLSSGGAVYGDAPSLPVDEDAACSPRSPYAETKLAAEQKVCAAAARGAAARVLRVGNVYGARQRHDRGQGLVATMLHAEATGAPVVVFGTGDAVRDYVDVRDVAEAVVALQDLGGAPVLNVGTGVGHSIYDVHKIVETVTGGSVALRHETERATDVRAVVLDCTRLRNLIDWQPRSLETGVADAFQAMRAPARARGGAPIGAG